MYRTSFSNKTSKNTKYGNKSYMSKFEAGVAKLLNDRLKKGEFVNITSQYIISLYVYLPDGDRVHVFDYVCDFCCERADGSFLLCEAKGGLTEKYRAKRKILDMVWLPDHPKYEFEEIRQA